MDSCDANTASAGGTAPFNARRPVGNVMYFVFKHIRTYMRYSSKVCLVLKRYFVKEVHILFKIVCLRCQFNDLQLFGLQDHSP